MNPSRKHNKRPKALFLREQGAALVELAIIIPLVIVTLAAGINFSIVIKSKQELSAFSREASNSTFQSCQASTDMPTCLQGVTDELTPLFGSAMPGSVLITSAYQMTSAVNVTQTATLESGPGYTSRFSLTDVAQHLVQNFSLQVRQTLAAQGTPIFISEVFHTVELPLPLTDSGFNKKEQVIYEATIH